LHVAARRGYQEVVEMLLEAGADPNAETHHGETALHLAASRPAEEVPFANRILLMFEGRSQIRRCQDR
jgi:ankyrin repeat protein